MAGTSLVRLSNALAAVDTELDDRKDKGETRNLKSVRPRFSANDAGRAAGRAAGDAATIRGTGLGAGSTTSHKRLS